MNFARHQEQAERTGRRLMWLHAAASVTVVIAVDMVATLVWHLLLGAAVEPPRGFHATNVGVVLGLVAGGAWLETARLRDDGALIARRLGAVALDTVADPMHRRLQNLLEELAIAARIGVPRAFVLEDEPTINALTAGMDRNQAVVVVTRGALARLTRDELQGVLAHEISHVVNGDVRLNTRLLGLNHGLQMVSLFGRSMLVRAFAPTGDPRALPLRLLIGVPLGAVGAVVASVGLIGAVAARVIQAGVGRQREYLADAQAIAFTRSRDGLGGALRKVAGQSPSAGATQVDPRRTVARRHPYWRCVSHLLLIGGGASRQWFETHPPLRDRVHRLYGRHMSPIEPRELADVERREPELPALAFAIERASLQGDDGDAQLDGAGDPHGPRHAVGMAAGAWPAMHAARRARSSAWADTRPVDGDDRDPAAWRAADDDADPMEATRRAVPSQTSQTSRTSRPSPSVSSTLHAMLDDSPGDAHALASARLVQATREPAGAAALVIALIEAAPHHEPRWDDGWASAASRHPALRAAIATLPADALRALRWPLMELAAARLRPMSRPSRDTLLATARAVVEADGRITLREWIYFGLLRLRLAPSARPMRRPVLGSPIDARSVRVLFGLLAHSAHVSEARADRAANAAIRALDLPPIGGSAGALTLDALDGAVRRAAMLPPLVRPLLVRHLASMLPADADAQAHDFLRLLCVAIDCPPPRLPRGARGRARHAVARPQVDAPEREPVGSRR